MAALVPLLLALAACGAPSSPEASSVPACDVSQLGVTVDAQLSIHVENLATDPCRLSGTPAVQMKVGRIDGPMPSTDVTLTHGQVFIQPQVRVPGAWACPGPISAGLPGKGSWTVTVLGEVTHPDDADAQLGRQVVNCWVVELPPGHLDAG